ncbi:ATP-binding protein [Brevundimonas sp. 2R-24]|uniref:histidine kinase n=1 Tax=Peiella sedimenti TaxID=3061083 RepID=A0ABT8SHP8_9CAUL|nr:ATP-binding protein [Caulobacteraceae bacterium XZ-24]
MQSVAENENQGWGEGVERRRKSLPQRLLLGCAAALIFSPLIGYGLATVWCAVYLAIQFVELAAFRPVARGEVADMGPVRNALATLALFLNAAAFSSLSIILWRECGLPGGIAAAFLVSAGCIYSVVNSIGSPRVLAPTLAAQFIYLALTPALLAWSGAEPTYVAAVVVAVGVFMAYVLSVSRTMQRYRALESSARIEAEARAAELTSVMQSKSMLLATVGHDLRTPISAMLAGVAELDRAPDPAVNRHARLIGDAANMMRGLLDDLLDHAKLEAGRLRVEPRPTNLRRLLAHTLRFWQAEAAKKGLKLRLSGSVQAPAWVEIDGTRLRQVLNNLMSNALKFTDEGHITVSLKAWPDGDNQASLMIEVADTGKGMDEGQLARLFTPFDQTRDGVAAAHGGTGLGLSISRELIHLMGGRLLARSVQGAGSAFTIGLTVPLAKPVDAETEVLFAPPVVRRATVQAADAPAPTLSPAAEVIEQVEDAEDVAATVVEGEPEEEGRPLRVLVVDDHEINRRAVQLILTPLGCDISTATDGLEALKALAVTPFDVVFMDVRMPELDGRETTRRLRAAAGPNQFAPVIAVTADTAEGDVQACLDAGMTSFVAKPLTPAVLLGALQAVLSPPAEDVSDDSSVQAA